MSCKFTMKEPEERREAYKMLREAGYNSYLAYRVRDWRLTKIKQFITLNPPWSETSKTLSIAVPKKQKEVQKENA